MICAQNHYKSKRFVSTTQQGLDTWTLCPGVVFLSTGRSTQQVAIPMIQPDYFTKVRDTYRQF
jgi:hypothetical protein